MLRKGMITPTCIEHYDSFGDSIVFWIEVGNVSKNYIDKAIGIDGQNYSSDCFGVCVVFDENGIYIIEDTPGCEMYYIDNNGNKHWFDKQLISEEKEDIFRMCRKGICEVFNK